jgi:hypothetical protein
MSSTAILSYSATAVGPVVPANLEAAMVAVDVQELGIEQITGAVLSGGATSIAGKVVTRTFIYDIATNLFQAQFPAGTDQASPFRGLFTQTLGAALKCPIAEAPVVIA